MKKAIYLMSLAVAAVSCTMAEPEKAEPRLNEDGLMEMTFSATAVQTETKVILSEEKDGERYPILWSPGDSISVFDVNTYPKQDAKLFNCSDTTCSTTSFSGLVAPSDTGYYAIYPWQKVSDVEEDGGLIDYNGTKAVHLAWCGYNQNATAFGFDPEKVLMMSYTDSDVFAFWHVFAFVKIKTTFDCEWIQIAGNNDERLGCQDVWLQMKNGIPYIAKTSVNKGGAKNVTLRAKSFGEKQYVPAGTYLVAVIPQTLEKGFTLTFKPTELSTNLTKTTSKAAILSRSNILNLGSFSKEDFSEFPTTGEWSGDGSESNPYVITTVEQWNKLSERLNGKYDTYKKYYDKYYKLGCDIDCEGKTIACVGNEMDRAFEGVFDGGGYTISNYYPSTGQAVEALFGYIESATIKNLTVDPAGFKGRYDGFSDFLYSPLIGVTTVDTYKGNAASKIINCHAKYTAGEELHLTCSETSCTYGSIIAGLRDKAFIMQCSSSINIVLQSDKSTFETFTAGGIAGRIYKYYLTDEPCVFDRCRNSGNIHVESCDEGCAGGILGFDYDHYNNDVILRMTNCENRGNITAIKIGGRDGDYQYGGGLVGKHDSDGRWITDGDPFFYNCLNAGDVYVKGSMTFTGGLTGYCYDDDTKFYNCVNLGVLDHKSLNPYFDWLTGNKDGEFHFCYRYVNDSNRSYAPKDEFTTEKLDANRLNIPDHPDKKVVFADYGEGRIYQYCSWTGDIPGKELRLSF